MKVCPGSTSTDSAAGSVISLPEGLIGFPRHTSFELFYQKDQLPFRWMRLLGTDTVHFVVIDPSGIIPDYEPELFDEDAAILGIKGPDDAQLVNIVTVGNTEPVTATVNLIGPVVINRHTCVAKQVVLANHSRWEARYPLVAQGKANA